MSQEIKGKLIVIGETQSFPSGFQKREFVIEELDGKYPQKLKFEAMKDGCEKLDAVRVGQVVNVSYNLRGNEYNGKYYVSLQAWKIKAEDDLGITSPEYGQPQRQTHQNGAPPPTPGAHSDHEEDDDSSIPF